MRKPVKKGLWQGLTLLFTLLLAISIIAGTVLEANRGAIDYVFGSVSEVLVSDEGELYSAFKPDAKYLNADGKTGNAKALIIDAIDLGRRQEAEGAVLLKNNGALPLASGSSVTLLGARSHKTIINSKMGQRSQGFYITLEQALSASRTDFDNTKIAAGGLGSSGTTGTINDYDFADLKYGGDGVGAGAGYKLNPTMIAAYEATCGSLEIQPAPAAVYKAGEPSLDDLGAASKGYQESFSQYSDAAIVVVGRGSSESHDYLKGGIDSSEKTDGITEPLQLTANERAIIDLACEKKSEKVFERVIVLVNTNSPMEIGELKNNDKIDAILWIGHPGNYGLLGVADILCGNVSPSGGLYDIYATNNLSAPAMMNMGEYTWANTNITRKDSSNYLIEAEGLYVGYRYYETRYYDCVYDQGNAKSSKGIYASSDNVWNYSEEVAYGFGYGLSYSDFKYEIIGEPQITHNQHEMYADVTVKVTNVGDYDAKAIVQVYGQSPYTDYDKEHGVEKSAIQLLGFDKTRTLKKGNAGKDSEQTITIHIDLQNFASYDNTWENGDGTKGTYILENGDYYFAVGNGAHDALNNLLAAQGKSTADGMDYEGKSELAKKWVYTYEGSGNIDYTTFGISKTGQQVNNQIDYIDWNNFSGTKINYLSRSDWEGTYPVEHTSLTAPDDMVPLLNGKIAASSDGKTYYTIATDNDVSAIKWDNSDTSYKFYEMALSDWDDPRWEDVLNQINLEEATAFNSNAGPNFLQLNGIDFKSITAAADNAGNGIVYTLNGTKDPHAPWLILEGPDSNWNGQVFGSAPVVASTFNPDLMYEIGNFVGNEALFTGITIVWGPGLNTHRHAYNGRSGEYYSEDPVLSGVCAMEFSTAARRKGLIAAFKHFAFNDQETKRTGLSPFMTEQRAREIELRAYQIGIEAVKYDGEGMIGLMTSFSKAGPVEVTNSRGLMTGILQQEWGFHGYATTDISDDKDLFAGMVYAGCTGYDLRSSNPTSKNDFARKIGAQADGIVLSSDMFANDATMQNTLKTSVKRTLWAFSQSNLMNRYNAYTYKKWCMTPWRSMYISALVITSVLTAASATMYVISTRKGKGEEEKC